jgi:hypothetical protein
MLEKLNVFTCITTPWGPPSQYALFVSKNLSCFVGVKIKLGRGLSGASCQSSLLTCHDSRRTQSCIRRGHTYRWKEPHILFLPEGIKPSMTRKRCVEAWRTQCNVYYTWAPIATFRYLEDGFGAWERFRGPGEESTAVWGGCTEEHMVEGGLKPWGSV